MSHADLFRQLLRLDYHLHLRCEQHLQHQLRSWHVKLGPAPEQFRSTLPSLLPSPGGSAPGSLDIVGVGFSIKNGWFTFMVYYYVYYGSHIAKRINVNFGAGSVCWAAQGAGAYTVNCYCYELLNNTVEMTTSQMAELLGWQPLQKIQCGCRASLSSDTILATEIGTTIILVVT